MDKNNFRQEPNWFERKEFEYGKEIAVFNTKEQIKAVSEERKTDTAIYKAEKLLELKEQYEARKELSVLAVYRQDDGTLMVGKVGFDGHINFDRPACAAKLASAKIYTSYYPYEKSCLVVTFLKGDSAVSTKMMLEDSDDEAMEFCKLLEKNIPLITTRRTKADVQDALFTFLMMSAEHIEIPNNYGYSKLSSGVWVYSEITDVTMEGIKNEIK